MGAAEANSSASICRATHENAYNQRMNPPPYEHLSPDCVLDALCARGYDCDGRLLPLNSYENRVYQAGMNEGPPLVVKFYRPQRWSRAAILEEHRFVAELAQSEVPVVAALPDASGETLFEHAGYQFAVFPKKGGRAPELDRAGTLEWIGRFIGRIHAIGALVPFEQRPALTLQTFGHDSRDFLLQNGFIPPELIAAWSSVVQQALDGVARCHERAGAVRTLRLHGDCHPGNILWTDDGPHFVDFDDARQGQAVQDLWMLLSGERRDMTLQLDEIIEGYEAFCEFDRRELHLIEALRTLRLLHYSAWLARRQNDPAFAVAFPWFNTVRYWQDRVLELREQIALMDEAPLAAG